MQRNGVFFKWFKAVNIFIKLHNPRQFCQWTEGCRYNLSHDCWESKFFFSYKNKMDNLWCVWEIRWNLSQHPLCSGNISIHTSKKKKNVKEAEKKNLTKMYRRHWSFSCFPFATLTSVVISHYHTLASLCRPAFPFVDHPVWASLTSASRNPSFFLLNSFLLLKKEKDIQFYKALPPPVFLSITWKHWDCMTLLTMIQHLILALCCTSPHR